MKDSTIRTRFAPSPTGYLHVGAARTALFAWLLAKQSEGSFILRIEDTDKKREVAGAEGHIIKSLEALGLQHDEGPDIGGNFGPYRQSERLEVYQTWAKKLISQGRAYTDPYTSDEITEFRQSAQANKKPFLYRNHRPDNPPEWDGTKPLRFKSDPKSYNWKDEVMGELSTRPEVIDDFILIKSDGYPTYNFAHIIDDHEMSVTHIIRGQEFIASVPNYLNLYEALELPTPVMATMPPILGPDGKKKLSKRDGATDIIEYIEQGFLPEALVSFIATLGWNDGTTKEIFSREDLLKSFSLKGVGRGGAVFDEKRLSWINGQLIRKLTSDELFALGESYLPEEAKNKSDGYNIQVMTAIQERLKFFAEIPELTSFFYHKPPLDNSLIDTHKKLKKYDNKELANLLLTSLDSLKATDSFTAENITDTLNALLEQTNEKPVVLFSLIRIAITRAPASPGLTETIVTLGKNEVVERISEQIDALQA